MTDDTDNKTFGKVFKRGDIGDFPKSASPSVTCHPLVRLIHLSKIGGCVLAIILNLVQRQKGRVGEGSIHTPQKVTGALRGPRTACSLFMRSALQVMGSPVSTGPFVMPKISWSLQACWQAGQ